MGGAANYIQVNSGGDIIPFNSGGLCFGCISGIDENVTCTVQNTWYQVTFDSLDPYNGMAPTLEGDYIGVTYSGVYLISITACFHSNATHDFELMAKKNSGVADVAPHLFQTTAVADKVENAAGISARSLSSSDTLELWVRCTSAAARVAEFDNVELFCMLIRGE